MCACRGASPGSARGGSFYALGHRRTHGQLSSDRFRVCALTSRVRALLLLGVVAIALALHPPPFARSFRELKSRSAARPEVRSFDNAKNNRLADGLMALLPVRRASLFSLDPGDAGPGRGERKPGRRYLDGTRSAWYRKPI